LDTWLSQAGVSGIPDVKLNVGDLTKGFGAHLGEKVFTDVTIVKDVMGLVNTVTEIVDVVTQVVEVIAGANPVGLAVMIGKKLLVAGAKKAYEFAMARFDPFCLMVTRIVMSSCSSLQSLSIARTPAANLLTGFAPSDSQTPSSAHESNANEALRHRCYSFKAAYLSTSLVYGPYNANIVKCELRDWATHICFGSKHAPTFLTRGVRRVGKKLF
jgi:hypothetical protein